ncbi:MAG: hypothetical protein CMH54_09705 [Myxococcales bacterium]|nr:hypothetical protein [Myxococcales bacterium]
MFVRLSLSLLFFGVIACSTDPGVRTVTLEANEGLIASDGTVVSDGSGLKSDLVAHKHSSSLDLKGGRFGTDYQPLHDFNRIKFDSLTDVPCTAPTDAEEDNIFLLPEEGHGFTVRANKTSGYFRVWIKTMDVGMVTLDYEFCD